MSVAGEPAFERARELWAGARRAVAFTGAGISAESGIPTYRDAEDSLWSQVDPCKLADIGEFLRDPVPYWRFFQDVRYRAIHTAQPNPGHRALAALDRAGRLDAVLTQNIDGLHQAAGSREVVELHGNTRTIGCLQCGQSWSMDEVYAMLRRHLPPPCPACGGRLKPKVVFFGEALPEEALARAADWVRGCDLLLAIGSSLSVYPAALLPLEARAHGAALVIVNRTPTPVDERADAVLHAAAGDALPRLARALGVAGE